MKLKKLTALFAAGLLMLFLSCENMLDITESAETSAAEVQAPDGTSKVTVTFPMISSSFMESLSSETRDRAYLFVKYAEIIVTDSEGAAIDSDTISTSSMQGEDFGAELTSSFYIPWGSDYTMTVNIYDAEEGTLLVSGSDSFDVGMASVDVAIALTPESAQDLSSASFSGSMVTSIYDEDSDAITYMGDEKWFSYAASAGEEFLIQLVSDNNDSMGALLLADSDGFYMGDGFTTSMNPDEPAYISATAGSEAETFYIGMGLYDGDCDPYTDDYTISCATQTGTILEMYVEDTRDLADTYMDAFVFEGGADYTTADPLAYMSGYLTDDVDMAALDIDTDEIWEAGEGTYDVYAWIDIDGDEELSSGDYFYPYTGVDLSGDGVEELELYTSSMEEIGGISPFEVTIGYNAAYNGSEFTALVYADGVTDMASATPVAYGYGAMSDSSITLSLVDYADFSSSWNESGDYELYVYASTDDYYYYYFDALTVDSSSESEELAYADFSSYYTGSDTGYQVTVGYDASFSGGSIMALICTDGTTMDEISGNYIAFTSETTMSDSAVTLSFFDISDYSAWDETGDYELFVQVDMDGDDDPDYYYFGALTTDGTSEETVLSYDDFTSVSSDGGYEVTIPYNAAFANSTIDVYLCTGGTTCDSMEDGMIAMNSVEMTDSSVTLSLVDISTYSSWYETGDYELYIQIDSNSNGELDGNEYFYFQGLAISGDSDSAEVAFSDFLCIDIDTAYTSSDIAGSWYAIFDYGDDEDDDYVEMLAEEILVLDSDGTYHQYIRRHEALSSDYFDYLEEDDFYEVEQGSYTIADNLLTLSPSTVDIYTWGLLAEEVTEADIQALSGLTDISGLLGLQASDSAYYDAIRTAYGDTTVDGFYEDSASVIAVGSFYSETELLYTCDTESPYEMDDAYQSTYEATSVYGEGFRSAPEL